jgi:hypothetical protein
MNRLMIVGALLSLVACGSDSTSPADACNMIDSASCERVYACLTAAEIAAIGYPPSESACVTMQESADGCSAKTTANACKGGNDVYHGDKVSGCVSQIGGLTCAQVRDPNFNINTAAPICAEVCVTPS